MPRSSPARWGPSTTRRSCTQATWSACCRRSSGISRICAPGPRIRTSTWRGSRRGSSRSCSRAPAATSCSPATRGAIKLLDADRARARLRGRLLRLLVPAGAGRAQAGTVHRRRVRWRPRVSAPRESFDQVTAHLPRARADRPRALFRAADVPARPAGRRGQAVDGALDGGTRPAARQRAGGLLAARSPGGSRTSLAAGEAPAPRRGAQLPPGGARRRSGSRASAHPTAAGTRAAICGTSARSCSTAGPCPAG